MASFIPCRIAFLACVAGALFAGCGNGASSSSFNPVALISPSAQDASWMAPEAKSKDLLYISDSGTVYAYTYPEGKLVGKLTGFDNPLGLCVDKAGDLYVTTGVISGKIFEYAHGSKKRKKVLKDDEDPQDCAVDPTTGNLAATNYFGQVAIYANATGSPQYISYTPPSHTAELTNCTYDEKGNLFIDAGLEPSQLTGFYQFAVGELPKGKSVIQTIWFPEGSQTSAGVPGGLQWSHKRLAVGDAGSGTIYFLNGNQLALDDASGVTQFWIQARTLIGPNNTSTTVMFWNYPAGGEPTKTLKGFKSPYGAAVSLAH
jgi:hypothetical protein